MKKVSERFLKYVKVDTQSVDDMEVVPSSDKIRDLAKILVEELREIGASDIRTDEEHCYVYATIPATTTKNIPTLGFVSHMDTSTALSGKNVNPQIISNYQGGDIVLNKELNIMMKEDDNESLSKYIGHDIIVTDGTTLLGADDKAGVAEIMSMAEYLLTHPEIEHGTIKIGFTPDEEVGRGVDFFDVEGFGADFAYTVDGGEVGELEYENFNAAGAKFTIQGKSIHPGSAKNKMIHSLYIAMELQNMLPVEQSPIFTEGYEGFYMLESLEGGVDSAKGSYIIRDHDKVKFEEKKVRFQKIVDYLNDKYGENTITLSIKDNYYNMKEKVVPHFHLIDNAKKALEDLGITPIITPIRGGTDGSRLSYMGLPCPNLGTGGHNFHGRYEYITIQSMEKSVEVLLRIIDIYTNNK